MITWGGLLGATFIGQQYTQNVLGYSPLSAAPITCPLRSSWPGGTAGGDDHQPRLPAARARAGRDRGRLRWDGAAVRPGASAVVVGIVDGVLGLGTGLAGPPSSSSLMVGPGGAVRHGLGRMICSGTSAGRCSRL